ncbi:MAG: thiolase family protein [Dehalococcoidales bacterium]|nr:MAG: thiolase family protein [Dehalococcoidales bacterium]
MGLKNKCAITGLGYTVQGKVPDRSAMSFYIEAAKNAIADAGLSIRDIDGIIIQPCPTDSRITAFSLAQDMGLSLRFGADQQLQGASSCAIIQHAAMAVDAGLCDYCLCAFADTSRSASPTTGNIYQRAMSSDAAYGMFGVAASYAMIARRYTHEYGITSRQFGAVSVAFRHHASLNPIAQMRQPITIDDHQASRWVVEPLHLFDCCLVSDGGRALIVTSAERARNLAKSPVYIMGMGQGHPLSDPLQRKTVTETGAIESGKTAFSMAGITRKDIDVCSIYDAFSFAVPMQLEDLGFCTKGEGGAFFEDGHIALGGALPTNTSGGLLSEVYIQGWVGTHEVISQLRGDCGQRQVPDAELGLVTSSGGVLSTHATLILRR